MFSRAINKGKKVLLGPQSSILSAASIIMVMVVAAKLLGFVRQRVLFSYFSPESTDLLLAAFELPDIIFEVFVFSTLSAAFIPVFSSYLSRHKEKTAWHVASASATLLFVIFSVLSLLIFIFAVPIYSVLTGDFGKSALGATGGFSQGEVYIVATLSRILLFSQFFFLGSALITGVLESYKRFLAPAIAPLFYNIGIILGIVFLSEDLGLLGPTLGAVFGAFLHLMVQLILSYDLKYKFRIVWDLKHPGVQKLIRLSTPRVLELSFLQLRRFVWLFLGSLVAGGFTYLKSADLLQALAVGVFGLSLAKAALPTLSGQHGRRDMEGFRKTFFTTLNQILFLVVPVSVFMIVLKVPVVRLVFGSSQFDWPATQQTGLVLAAFSIGTFAYAGTLLVNRAFYALQDTKTPVAISIISVILQAILGFWFVLRMGTGTWGIALAYAIAGTIQFFVLTFVLIGRINGRTRRFAIPFAKTYVASLVAGGVMYFLLKIFDKSVWVKKLSFLNTIDQQRFLTFEQFTIDTRYTFNLFALTVMVSLIGVTVYIVMLILLRSEEVWTFFGFARRLVVRRRLLPLKGREQEQITPPPTDTTST